MAFYDNEHKNKIKELEKLWEGLEHLTIFAKQHGINDIFQDNGAKVLQQLIILNMNILSGREGNDAVSENGTEWEMKSINTETTATGFSTNHHVTHDTIKKYKQVHWSFAIYSRIYLQKIYVMKPDILEKYYIEWEKGLLEKKHLNNPKINLTFVQENGIQVYPINEENPINPDSI